MNKIEDILLWVIDRLITKRQKKIFWSAVSLRKYLIIQCTAEEGSMTDEEYENLRNMGEYQDICYLEDRANESCVTLRTALIVALVFTAGIYLGVIL